MTGVDIQRLDRLLVDRFLSDRHSGFLVQDLFPNCPIEFVHLLEFVSGGYLKHGGIVAEGRFSFGCFLSITSTYDFCNLFWRWRVSGSPAGKIPFALSLGNGDYFFDIQTGVVSVDYPDDPKGSGIVSEDLGDFFNSIQTCDSCKRLQIESEIDPAKRLRGFLEIADDQSAFAELRCITPELALGDEGWTALQWAVIENRVRVVEFCFSQGITEGQVDRKGNSLLHLAAMHGSLDVLRFFEKSKPKLFLELIEAVNEEGESPLWLALAWGRTRCAIFLAVSGADSRKRVRMKRIDEWFRAEQWSEWNEFLEKGFHREAF
jgi:hypothetical protein